MSERKEISIKISRKGKRTNLLLDTGKHNRDQQRSSAVADCPTRSTKSVTLGTQPCRENLSRINERDHQPRRAEDNDVEEDHDSGSGAVLFGLIGVVDGSTVQATTGGKSVKATRRQEWICTHRAKCIIPKATAPQKSVRRRPTRSKTKAATPVPRIPQVMHRADNQFDLKSSKPAVR